MNTRNIAIKMLAALEAELQPLADENAELKRRNAELVEAAKPFAKLSAEWVRIRHSGRDSDPVIGVDNATLLLGDCRKIFALLSKQEDKA